MEMTIVLGAVCAVLSVGLLSCFFAIKRLKEDLSNFQERQFLHNKNLSDTQVKTLELIVANLNFQKAQLGEALEEEDQ